MAIQPVQLNNIQGQTFKKDVKPYLQAEGAVETDDKVKPLNPKGHLVDDNLFTGTKYFFKDIAYDMKSLKNGIKGTANDHQLGRLNDVGLRLGGIGIAAYLASRTTSAKVRIMEYIGLGVFLTSMAIYPKIAINTPARILHGYDIDKEYIDDQGRKKSVQQDSNYVPYDMYLGGNKGEDLTAIGDRMGIPKNIKNRDELTKEQMRKIATQNNTMWMLTAGFATPLMTALICNLIENHVVSPALEKTQNAKVNKMIEDALKRTENMSTDVEAISSNELSERVSGVLKKYSGAIIPEQDKEYVIELMTKDMDSITADGIRKDLSAIFEANSKTIVTEEAIEEMIVNAKKQLGNGQRKVIDEVITPSKEELIEIIKSIKNDADFGKGVELNENDLAEIRKRLKEKINERISKSPESKKHLKGLNMFGDKFVRELNLKGSKVKHGVQLGEEVQKSIIDFAKIMGEFKANHTILDRCKNVKIEMAPDTMLANSYNKFQKVLMEELGFSTKELKMIRDNREYAQKAVDERFKAISSDPARSKRFFERLSKVFSEMEVKLNGENESKQMLDLITGIENNYNKTAQRLHKTGICKETINRLVKDPDIDALSPSLKSLDEMRDLLDGLVEDKFKGNYKDDWAGFVKYNARGKGSARYNEVSRIVSRYQGVTNSFMRIFHAMDIYGRAANPEEIMKYMRTNDKSLAEYFMEIGKKVLLDGTSSDYVLKFNINNPEMNYTDLIDYVWAADRVEGAPLTKEKGYITDAAKDAINSGDKNKDSYSIVERIQYYIAKIRNIFGSDSTDIGKPNHITNYEIRKNYNNSVRTNSAKFDLVGQNPIDMIQNGAAKRYSDKMWMRAVGISTAVVFGVAILSQFCFGKIKNPQNMKKQVKNDSDK